MKKTLLFVLSLLLISLLFVVTKKDPTTTQKVVKIERKTINPTHAGKKKTLEERALYNEARNLHEFYRQVNPLTGVIPKEEKNREFKQATSSKLRKNLTGKVPQTTYINRGASNLGGRTRTIVIDKSDNTGNTIIAGGVSGGVFRTTNGGASWTKVSANDEIHNVTSIAQDPTNTNIWYYATGEGLGNSASLSGSFYFGQGIWQSIDGGLTWSQIASTASDQDVFNAPFDIIFKLAVHPTSGNLYAATFGRIMRYNNRSWTTEIDGGATSTNRATDVVITTGGRVYAAFSGTHDAAIEGVWTSANGVGGWSRINNNGIDPAYFTPAGRVVLALAPSNQNKLYTLFVNGNGSDCSTTPAIEADLWMWDQSTLTYTDYSSKLPDETGCSNGNDPFAVQGGYDLVVSVKPDNENFVVIGGTNSYKMSNITGAGTFTRIGGYASASGYAQYANNHPDIHALVFSPFNSNVLLSGTDGGIHRTSNITAPTVGWTSLNNNYQTQQYYHVAIDPATGSDIVLGGLQDNGTNAGGMDYGQPDLTTQTNVGTGDGAASAISRDDACIPFFISVQNGTLYRDCPTFANITPEESPGVTYESQFVTYFYLDPDNNNALYYAAEKTLLRTTDATNVTASTWTDMGATNTTFSHLDSFQTFSTTRGTYNPATSYLLMGGDAGHIYRLDDPQNAASIASAVDITPPTATIEFPSIVTGLAIHPTNRDIVLATYSNYGTESIFLTTNATNASPTWTLVERNLSSHSIRSAAIAEVSGQTIYFVGTARGLYSSQDPTTTDWVRESPDEIGFALVSSLAYRPSDNHLLIGTHGNGMYESIITDVLNTNDINDISHYISLFPNPTTDEINLNIPQEFGNSIKYSIKNMLGQSITNGTLLSNKIDVSTLQTGMYFIELNTGDKKGTKKFIRK
ncbi:T9SS type A sorting domain-containing protein [Sabulilitoribacter multivorans]|uniref:T9SS type A sorting domain-containing protein n=1 Tax=Flaviramulus multivorans TaxID=1304750 RepID=A0ABS9IFK1_9FLAO|nr:T9SS type A sorting domain-containing protein [Flaviramulus multivorans]MCF7559175.1 T9SS type A sorting domain-containing protein [Flaviramulus multivorans]